MKIPIKMCYKNYNSIPYTTVFERLTRNMGIYLFFIFKLRIYENFFKTDYYDIRACIYNFNMGTFVEITCEMRMFNNKIVLYILF